MPDHETVTTAERIGAGVAGALIIAGLAFASFAPSEGANIGGGMLIMMAGLVGAACYGIGKLVGKRRQ